MASDQPLNPQLYNVFNKVSKLLQLKYHGIDNFLISQYIATSWYSNITKPGAANNYYTLNIVYIKQHKLPWIRNLQNPQKFEHSISVKHEAWNYIPCNWPAGSWLNTAYMSVYELFRIRY